MSYRDRYKGRRIQDPPSVGRFALFILVGAAFAAFVGTLRGLDSSLCALATLTVVACKLLVELIATRAKLQLPERFTTLPLAVWLLVWLVPIPPFWFVLRTIWPKNVDPNNAISVLTLICFALYIPTIMAVVKPPANPETAENKEDSGAEKINMNIDFNSCQEDEQTRGQKKATAGDSSATAGDARPTKGKNKGKRKGKK